MAAAPLATTARAAVFDRLEREPFDLAVIGGGISGAGIAQHAALRGLRVALLEAEDFATGTSSRSSKLIHGGLRYLAHGDVGLVRRTALERIEIHRQAPHLAEPSWMLVPSRSRAGMLKLRAGVASYEKLGGVSGDDLHRNWGAEELAREEPLLDGGAFRYACVYREYRTDDAHLVLANLRAAAGLGAAVANFAPVEGITREQGRASGVEASCQLTDRRVRIRARCVINAAGPWVDPVRQLEEPGAPGRLQLSKGVHVVLPAERLPVRHMVICTTRDRRSIFAIPHGECVYVGTTDTIWSGGTVAWPPVGLEDVEYLLEALSRTFRCDPLRPDDVVAAWAGLRPLIAQPGKAPTEVSRRDEVWVGPARVITVAGGKLTGYRLMARQTVEKAAEACELPLAPLPEEQAPLPGGDFSGSLDELAAGLAGVTRDCAQRLVRLYGAEAASLVANDPQPLLPGAPALAAEVDWAVDALGAVHLEDVLYRRMRSAWYLPAHRESLVEPVARRMAGRLGWDAERREREIAAVRERLAADLAFLAESPR